MMESLVERVMFIIPLILSLTVHEYAHAWAANLLGDDTARLQGRMTLDPMPHLDPLGTVLFPLMGVPLGWANPVMVNPNRFRLTVHPVAGMAVVAAAGPLSNFVLAAGAWGVTQVVPVGAIGALAQTLVSMNIALGLFNLLPIPPLDGSRVLDVFVPNRLRGAWAVFQRYGIVLAVVLGTVGWVIGSALTLAVR